MMKNLIFVIFVLIFSASVFANTEDIKKYEICKSTSEPDNGGFGGNGGNRGSRSRGKS